MSHLKYFNYRGFGEETVKSTHHSQAVRVGDRIETAGQGGWDPETGKLRGDLAEEIAQAFANVDLALKTAGGQGWSQVYRINMYLAVDFSEQVFGLLVENLKKALLDHAPTCTALGVRALAFEGMRIEIEAVAHVGIDSRVS